jgi:hypothetical protein
MVLIFDAMDSHEDAGQSRGCFVSVSLRIANARAAQRSLEAFDSRRVMSRSKTDRVETLAAIGHAVC